MKAIFNGLIVTPNRILTGNVLLYDENVCEIRNRKGLHLGRATELINAEGGFVVPGFINEHIHGLGGVDTMDDDDQALATMQQLLPKTGVTSFLPTTMTMEQGRIEKTLDRIRKAKGNPGAQILGAHLEGPFVSPDASGSQDAQYIQHADFSWLAPYADIIKIITVAPETLGSHAFLKACKDRGIIISLGHTAASYDQAMDAIDYLPMCHATHLFNAMTGFHHRAPGVVGAALLSDKVHCELICDNLHVHPAAQKLAYQLKGNDGIILVTDSLRACLMGDGESSLGGQTVYVKDGEARLADGTLAASIVPMNEVVLHFLENSGAAFTDVIAMASANPAKDLGIYDRVGSLEPGKQADITILDGNDLHVKHTIIAGEHVYNEYIEAEKAERAQKNAQ